MDTLCGLGLPELVIIALVGFVLIGPERSQEVALTAGRTLRNLVKSSWWNDFTEVTKAVRDLPTTLIRMAELEEAQTELREVVSEIDREARVNDVPVTPPQPPAGPPQSKFPAVTDPWGIENAVSGTTFSSKPARKPTDEPHAESEDKPDTDFPSNSGDVDDA